MQKTIYDMVIIGAGPSGGSMAEIYSKKGLRCLLLEAGSFFNHLSYPRKEIDSNSQLYWSGGIELNKTADLGILRPKVVGGGSIVNQALLDPFDYDALESFKKESGISFFTKENLDPVYETLLSEIATEKIASKYRNKNALIFQEGFKKNGHECDGLLRAQSNCMYEEGNDCIECLSGCRIDSKQSAAITFIPRAIKNGLKLVSQFEVKLIKKRSDEIFEVGGHHGDGSEENYYAKNITLASGAIGNSKLLIQSGWQKKNKNIGKYFYTHPQFMVLGIYDEKINAHKGPFQSMKSADKSFRMNKFKLENVFGPPVAISMLLPGIGKRHLDYMRKITQMACIEVAIRDQNPGTISVSSSGKVLIDKVVEGVDLETKNKGLAVIHQIFNSTGAKEIINGELGIGLHLMGGCRIGQQEENSVIDPDFCFHGEKNIFCADSSIFPNAPGINPSLTILALSKMAAQKIVAGL